MRSLFLRIPAPSVAGRLPATTGWQPALPGIPRLTILLFNSFAFCFMMTRHAERQSKTCL